MSLLKKRILGILLLLPFFTFGQTQTGINFVSTSWDEAISKARKEGKPIFLYAYSPGCHFCKEMEKNVFPDKEVVDFYNSGFVSYKINIEDKASGEALSKKYNIVAFPTYVFFDKNANRVHQSGAAKSAELFILDGKNAFDPQKAVFTLKNRYEKGDRSPSLLYDYSNALASYFDANTPQDKVVQQYIATQSDTDLESEKNIKFIFTRYLSYESPTTQYFLKNQDKFSPVFTPLEVEHKANRIISQTASKAGRENNVALLQDLKKVAVTECRDSIKTLALTQINFYGGKRDWLQYAKATLDYSKLKQGENDFQTFYETSVYLKYFAKETDVLKMGVELMEKVILLKRSYLNLCLYAQLQNKVGQNALALKAANEALIVAKQEGEDDNDAKDIIAQVNTSQKQ